MAPGKGRVKLLAAWAPPRLCVHAVRAQPTPARHPEFQTDLAVCIACFDSITFRARSGKLPLSIRAAAVLATRGGPSVCARCPPQPTVRCVQAYGARPPHASELPPVGPWRVGG